MQKNQNSKKRVKINKKTIKKISDGEHDATQRKYDEQGQGED